MKRAAFFAIALGACNAVFGLEPPVTREATDATDDAPDDAVVLIDASDEDAVSFPDAPPSPIDATVDAPIDAPPLPIDAPGCTPCNPVSDGNECTLDVCCNGVTTHPPATRDTFCNGFADQCDGFGNCVDCTNSGGCGECCVCFNQACIPA